MERNKKRRMENQMVNYRERMEEYEIDLKDLLYRVVLKWRHMLVVFVVVGALFGVVSGVKSFQDVKNAEIALAEQNKQGGPKEGEAPVVVPELKIINVTNIVLGGFIGAFVFAMIPACSYMFSAKLRHEDDLIEIFELHSVASYPNYNRLCKKDSKIDLTICKLFWKNKLRLSDKEKLNVAVTDCVMSMAQKGYKSICFISSVSGEFEHVNEIVDKLSQVVDTCVLEKSILSSAKSLQSVQMYDCAVIVEKLDQSYYEDIIRELEYCERFNVPVLGSIVEG